MKNRFLYGIFLITVGVSSCYGQSPSLRHSPTKAVVMSALLPGLGQIYNRQYWKTPVIYAGMGTTAYFAVVNKRKADLFKQEYRLRTNNISEGRLSAYARYTDDGILALYNAYEKNFELSIMVGALVYLLNIADALVYAHLFEFDISDKLSLKVSPLNPFTVSSQSPILSSYGINIAIQLR